MRATLVAIALILGFATAIAWHLRPGSSNDGVVQLGWTTLFSQERREQAELYNELHPENRIVPDYNYTNLDKILVQASSGVGAVLVDVYGPDELQTLVEAGIAMPLPRPASPRAPWKGSEALTSYDGERYAASVMVWADILYINRSVFEELGIASPTESLTWTDFFELCEKIRLSAHNRGIGIVPLPALPWSVFFASRRGEYFSRDGTQPQLTGLELHEAFALHRDAIFSLRIALSETELKVLSPKSNATAMFADGQFAMMIGAMWHMKWFRRYGQLQRHDGGGKNLRITAVPLPHFGNCPPSYLIHGRGMAINALSPVRERAVSVLEHLQSPDHAALINRQLDGLPPNPVYSTFDKESVEPDPDLDVRAAHAASLFAMAHGYTRRASPYYLSGDVERLLADKVQRLETDPAADIGNLLADAEMALEVLRERRMRRDHTLSQRYKSALKEKPK